MVTSSGDILTYLSTPFDARSHWFAREKLTEKNPQKMRFRKAWIYFSFESIILGAISFKRALSAPEISPGVA